MIHDKNLRERTGRRLRHGTPLGSSNKNGFFITTENTRRTLVMPYWWAGHGRPAHRLKAFRPPARGPAPTVTAVPGRTSADLSIKTIMRELGLAEETVRRFCRADPVDDLLAKRRAGQPSILDAFKPFPHQAWNDGCRNVLDLHRQITVLGYRGTYSEAFSSWCGSVAG
jgi:hypothetical protein